MTCAACVQAIETQLKEQDIVQSAAVSLSTCEGRILYNSTKAESPQIKEWIEDCGFDCIVVSDTICNDNKVCGFKVSGMTCSACVNTITSQLLKMDGISNVDLSLITQECMVIYAQDIITPNQIKECIEDCGFDADTIQIRLDSIDEQLVKGKFNVFDNYSTIVQKFNGYSQWHNGLKTIEIVPGQDIDNNCEITIEYDHSIIGIRDLISLCKNKTNLDMIMDSSHDKSTQLTTLQRTKEISLWKSRCMKSCLIAIITMTMYMGVPMLANKLIINHIFPYKQINGITELYYRDFIGFILASYVLFRIGSHFYISCWKSLIRGTGTMDTLITISTLSAYFFSMGSIIYNIVWKIDHLPSVVFDTAIMLIAFISIGKLLENRAKSQTSTALSHLIELTPNTCSLVVSDTTTEEIPLDLLQINDVIEVKPGMKIPTDGIVTHGETEIDESLMTGESNLIHKQPGSHVIGGTINGPGHFYFKVTTVGQDTKLQQIITTIKNAQLTKTPIQKYADKLCSIFVPVILFLAVLTFVTWYFISKSGNSKSFQIFTMGEGSNVFKCLRIATSVVIVACPCALGLATPTAIMVGTGIGAQNGALIKNGDVIEKCKDIKGFVFDKTGTLTTGLMTVENFKYLNNESTIPSELMWYLVKLCEIRSEHPVAKTIVNYSTKMLSETGSSKLFNLIENDCNIIMGQGVRCAFRDDQTNDIYNISIGSGFELFSENVQNEINKLTELQMSKGNNMSGYTIAYVSINDTLIGKFEIIDTLRDDSYSTIQYLKSSGYEVYIVTGDNEFAANKIAVALDINIENVFSNVLPTGKCDVVTKLQETSGDGAIVFVGDGINDSPALVTSDIGIAISTGTEIAIDAADIVILADEPQEQMSNSASLKRLIYALDIAQKTYSRIKLNLFWALSYNTFMVPIAMGVLVPWGITLPPMIAGLAMALSSVSVVLSSLQLKNWEPPIISSGINEHQTVSLFDKIGNKLTIWRSRNYVPLQDDLEMNVTRSI
ncbi:hypothetical protein C6P45_000424 [Maudiozyma exigua]|uniref:P-type Cu(+) transporter n=1 Tax=Maudiozyma exigua TaxID=34358 RepID=A0A9P6W8D3_MAUEX|nr:hypothetical protein C6P45_000424 [Kazachstania exigua]